MIVSLRLLSILTVLLQLSTIVSSLTNVPPPGALEGEGSSTRWPWSSSEGSLEDSFERRKRDDVVPDDAVVMNGTTNSTDDSQIEGQTDINGN
ncbi:hypothetical protein ANCCAN_12722 [Ancylostoma caninum]|uniref:Secreted protein n=1 Tax=Ancylostoma caninum TaxID=29170 RepID=A0A368GDK3_ANCCA|nr:hypothetical protein ANCCAN_12722 [Ancylostoma caninum]